LYKALSEALTTITIVDVEGMDYKKLNCYTIPETFFLKNKPN